MTPPLLQRVSCGRGFSGHLSAGTKNLQQLVEELSRVPWGHHALPINRSVRARRKTFRELSNPSCGSRGGGESGMDTILRVS